MGIFVLVFFLACLFYFLNVLAYIYEITMLLHFMLLKHFMLYAYAVKCKCCVIVYNILCTSKCIGKST